jgi:TrmH family RNA methyltransferase
LGRITNPANDQVRAAVAIRDRRRVRLREGRFLVEGLRLVRQGLHSGARPSACYVTDDAAASEAGRALLEDLADVPTWSVTDEVMATLADTVTPQGIVALFPLPPADPSAGHIQGTILVLDAVADPGNVGTILRTALASGVSAALLSKGCVDPFDPKVVRSAMGAHFALAIHSGLSWPMIVGMLGERQRILADARGDSYPWLIDWTRPSALVVASEAHGPSAEARAAATRTVRLPMAEPVESLNAAVAAAQLMYELQRQRLARADDVRGSSTSTS